jgi:succinylarginine dihydrolase
VPAHEFNFDGLVGPTHNYSGLSHGNVASEKHKFSVAHPKQAALEGLAKMKLLAGLGVKQAVLPPQERPDVATLRRLGFGGSDAEVIKRAFRDATELLVTCTSASAMWAANAATVSPSADTQDGRVHFTPANLLTNLHRSIEPPTTTAALRAIFADEQHFVVHDPLPATDRLSDEGAANHTRLAASHGSPGVEFFVYGRAARVEPTQLPRKYPARQTLDACGSIARLHGLDSGRTVFARQSAEAIDAGVFHNDVIAVGNESLFLCHAGAYADHRATLDELRRKFQKTSEQELIVVEIQPDEISLTEAVELYLFNSQVVTLLPDGKASGGMAMICPAECRDSARARAVLDRLQALPGVERIEFADVRQSMRNGGGPACLRLRVVLTEAEERAVLAGVLWSESLHERLSAWVQRHYRDELRPEDLGDPKLLDECRAALDELTRILGMGRIYTFQRGA